MTISREKLLLRQIERVKGQLAALGELRPGSLFDPVQRLRHPRMPVQGHAA